MKMSKDTARGEGGSQAVVLRNSDAVWMFDHSRTTVLAGRIVVECNSRSRKASEENALPRQVDCDMSIVSLETALLR